MRLEFRAPSTGAVASELFLTWAPTELQVVETTGAAGTASVQLRNESTASGGQVVFSTSRNGPFTDDLNLTVTAGTPVGNVFVAGKFGQSSTDVGDATFEAIDLSDSSTVGRQSAMVRIRKNANGISTPERDRFLSALGQLNDQGRGDFQSFADMHTAPADPEAHRNNGFLPWHRAYLLDLERELQQIDASVSLHYWRFDQPAPNLFDEDFMGIGNSPFPPRTVRFSATNPLRFWVTNNIPGIDRNAAIQYRDIVCSGVWFLSGPE